MFFCALIPTALLLVFPAQAQNPVILPVNSGLLAKASTSPPPVVPLEPQAVVSTSTPAVSPLVALTTAAKVDDRFPEAKPLVSKEDISPIADLLASDSLPDHFSSTSKDNRLAANGVSDITADLIDGLLWAFMRKMNLGHGEKSCLRATISDIAMSVVSSGNDAVVALKRVFAKQNTTMDVGDTLSDLSPLVFDAGTKLVTVVLASEKLIKGCVTGAALEELQQSAQHLRNMTYFKQRLVANGVDIAAALAHSVSAWDDKKYYEFGKDIGTALRKIFLSKVSGASELPEGLPDKTVIQEATEGLMRGFFVSGSAISFTDSADPNISMQVNLHKCIGGNGPLFHTIWDAVWALIGKMSTNEEEYGLTPIEGSRSTHGRNTQSFLGDFALLISQLPGALVTCGLDQRTSSMLFEATKTLNATHVALKLPGSAIEPGDAGKLMAAAVSYWAHDDFKRFGMQIGVLLRETMLAAFPEKYSVDAAGRLRLSSSEKSGLREMLSAPAECFVCGVFLALLAVRFRRQRRTAVDSSDVFLDVESNSDVDHVVE